MDHTLARNWRSRGEAQTWRQASEMAVTHTCAFPHLLRRAFRPLTQAGSHFLSLHLPFWETEAQRCKDMGQVTQAVEGRSQARNPESGKKLGPPGLAWAPVRILRRGQGTRRSCGDPGLGQRLQSGDLTDEGQRAGVSTAKWASGFGSIPTSALPHPL